MRMIKGKKNENVKTWETIAKRLTNEKKNNEKLKRVEESMMMNKSNVEENNYEARRKRRIIVYTMQEKEEKTDRGQASNGYDWRYGCEGERGGGSRCVKNEEEGGRWVDKINYC